MRKDEITMKIRLDFITNSSSSSFIAINHESYNNNYSLIESEEDKDNFVLFESGNKEFGWEQREYKDMESKVNYILIQIADLDYYSNKNNTGYFSRKISKELVQSYKSNIESILYENLGITKINWDKLKQLIDDSSDIYIDHQSSFYENPYLEEFIMTRLEDFLFNDKSVIITGNDNVYEENGNFNGLDDKYRYNNNYSYVFS